MRLADGVLFYFLSKCWPDTHTNFILVSLSFFFCRLNDIKPIVSVCLFCLFFFLLFADKNLFLFVFYFVCFFPPPNSSRSFRLDLGANFLIRLKKEQNKIIIKLRREKNQIKKSKKYGGEAVGGRGEGFRVNKVGGFQVASSGPSLTR